MWENRLCLTNLALKYLKAKNEGKNSFGVYGGLGMVSSTGSEELHAYMHCVWFYDPSVKIVFTSPQASIVPELSKGASRSIHNNVKTYFVKSVAGS